MNTDTKQLYGDTISMISHLILTAPNVLIALLDKHGVKYTNTPSKEALTDGVIRLLKVNTPRFEQDLSEVLTRHMQEKNTATEALEHDAYFEDGDYDTFWKSVAKVGVGLVGSLLKGGGKKRRRRRDRSGSSSAALLAAQSRARQQARMNEARMRREFEMKMKAMKMKAMEMQRKQEQQAAAERRKREQEEAKAKRKQQNMYIGLAVVGSLFLGGIVFFSNRPKPAIAYAPPLPARP